MEISPYMLTLLLVYSFLFGMAAGVFNDMCRISRALLGERLRNERAEGLYEKELWLVGRLPKRKSKKILGVVIFLEDILLFVFIGCGIVILNFYLNRGQMRLYTVTAVGAGFLVYYFTLGKLVMLLSDYIVFIIRAALAIAFKIVSFPLCALGRSAKKIILPVLEKIKLVLEKRALVRYNKREEERLLAENAQGDCENDKEEAEKNEV